MSKIEPALTPEEWARKAFLEHDGCNPTLTTAGNLNVDGCVVKGRERHAVAALALHGQPFGFSWEDVDMIRTLLWAPYVGVWEDLADRIEALLPPREASD